MKLKEGESIVFLIYHALIKSDTRDVFQMQIKVVLINSIARIITRRASWCEIPFHYEEEVRCEL